MLSTSSKRARTPWTMLLPNSDTPGNRRCRAPSVAGPARHPAPCAAPKRKFAQRFGDGTKRQSLLVVLGYSRISRGCLRAERAMGQAQDQEGFSEEVQCAIAKHLDICRPTARDIAANMSLSFRTFQRRLAAENTNYSILLDTVLRDRALVALMDGRESCETLSVRLGYRQQSTFTRAVRRWTGQPPTALRQQSRDTKL